MFNAVQGVDALLDGLGSGMSAVVEANRRRAAEREGLDRYNYVVGLYEDMRQKHNVLVEKLSKERREYNELVAQYNDLSKKHNLWRKECLAWRAR